MSTTASAEPSLEELFAPPPTAASASAGGESGEDFVPQPPDDFKQAGITSAMAEALLFKFLLATASSTRAI